MNTCSRPARAGIVLASALTLLVTAPPIHAGPLKKIGRAIAYPVKKAAGNGSKVANKSGQAVAYPVRKAGGNTSKTARKVTGK